MPGPNDKCPCGSGKKYKRCCQQQDDARRSEEIELQRLESENPHDDLEDDDFFDELDLDDGVDDWTQYAYLRSLDTPDAPKETEDGWTPSKVAAQSTEEILGHLHTLGVETSREKFLALAEGRLSAWSVFKAWQQEPSYASPSDEEDDFAGLAACELWKRWLPERPSDEMIEDCIQAGFEAGLHDAEAECEAWWKAWQALSGRLTPQMRSFEDADELFHGSELFSDWARNFMLSLHTAAIGGSRAWAQKGLQLCEALTAQFPDAVVPAQQSLAHLHADFLLVTGEPERAIAELRAAIARWPDCASFYRVLADHLADDVRPGSRTPEKAEAIALYEAGMARLGKTKPEKAMRLEFEERIEELRGKQ